MSFSSELAGMKKELEELVRAVEHNSGAFKDLNDALNSITAGKIVSQQDLTMLRTLADNVRIAREEIEKYKMVAQDMPRTLSGRSMGMLPAGNVFGFDIQAEKNHVRKLIAETKAELDAARRPYGPLGQGNLTARTADLPAANNLTSRLLAGPIVDTKKIDELSTKLHALGQEYVHLGKMEEMINVREGGIAAISNTRITARQTETTVIKEQTQALNQLNIAQGGTGDTTIIARMPDELARVEEARIAMTPAATTMANNMTGGGNFTEEGLAKSLRGGVVATENALQAAAKYHYTLKDLSKVTTEASSGISRMTFAMQDQSGVGQRLTVSVDKWGNVLADTQRRFRSFGDAVVKNFFEVMKWTIAVGMVYGPMRALQDLLTKAIENETKLVDVTIAMGNAQREASVLFDVAADTAQATGEEVNKVIDAYVLAYRATGNISSETERFTTANKLLLDSLTLSKLAAIDEATASDTLTASLRQVAGELSAGYGINNALLGGEVLMNKWIATTRAANVDLATLATSFAIVGEAAGNANLNIDELNGIIAAIAETGVASGREAANIGRALIAGFQTDRSIAELSRFGVAVKTTTGEMRGFLEIMSDIYQLKSSGLISDEQFAKLTLVLGGGTRRQAPFQAFIENYPRVEQVAKMSALANAETGEAAEAMGLKLDTAQSAIQNLNTAFQTLAQTLGKEGGILTIFKDLTKLATTLLEVVNGVAGALGKAGPMLAVAGIGAAYLGTRSPLQRADMSGKMSGFGMNILGAMPFWMGGASKASAFAGMNAPGGQANTNVFGSMDNNQNIAQLKEVAQIQQGASQRQLWAAQQMAAISRSQKVLGGISGGQLAMGALMGALPAYGNISQARTAAEEGRTEEAKRGYLSAGANIGGAIVGTIIAGGNPIGGAIGAAIAEAFVRAATNRVTLADIITMPAELTAAPKTEKEQEAFDRAKKLKTLEDEAELRLMGGNTQGRETTGFQSGVMAPLMRVIFSSLAGGFSMVSGQQTNAGQVAMGTRGLLNRLTGKPENFGMEEVIRDYQRAMALAEVDKGAGSAAFTEQTTAAKAQYGATAEEYRTQALKELHDQLLANKITSKEYGDQVLRLDTLTAISSQLWAGAGVEFVKMNADVKDGTGAIKEFAEILQYAPQESLQLIATLTAEVGANAAAIKGQKDELKLLTKGTQEYADALAKLIILEGNDVEAKKALATLMTAVRGNAELAKAFGGGVPGLTDVRELKLTGSQVQKLKADALRIRDTELAALNIEGAAKQAAIEGFSDVYVQWEDAAGMHIEKIRGITSKYWQDAVKEAQDAGEIIAASGIPMENTSIPFKDITKMLGTENFQAPLPTSEYGQIAELLKSIGVKLDEDTKLMIEESTGKAKLANVDARVLQMIMGQVRDIDQKQLDGLYNIPEGATFWVPVTAASQKRTGGTGGGGGDLDALVRTLQLILEQQTKPTTVAAGPMTEDEEHMRRLLGYDWGAVFDPLASATNAATVALGGFTEGLLTGGYSGEPYAGPKEGFKGPRWIPPEAGQDTGLGSMLAELGRALEGILGIAPGTSLKIDFTGLQNALIAMFSTPLTMPNAPTGTTPGAGTNPAGFIINLILDTASKTVIDGQMVANVVKKYFAKDFVKAEGTAGSITVKTSFGP
jgi:hypothetical protein